MLSSAGSQNQKAMRPRTRVRDSDWRARTNCKVCLKRGVSLRREIETTGTVLRQPHFCQPQGRDASQRAWQSPDRQGAGSMTHSLALGALMVPQFRPTRSRSGFCHFHGQAVPKTLRNIARSVRFTTPSAFRSPTHSVPPTSTETRNSRTLCRDPQSTLDVSPATSRSV